MHQVRVLVWRLNTWGWKPTKENNPTPRYADTERWPGVMQSALGQEYAVEVNGLIARARWAWICPKAWVRSLGKITMAAAVSTWPLMQNGPQCISPSSCWGTNDYDRWFSKRLSAKWRRAGSPGQKKPKPVPHRKVPPNAPKSFCS